MKQTSTGPNTPSPAARTVREMISEIQKAVIGKDDIIIRVLLAILAKGHVLIEDIPGVGKTTLALAISRVLSLDYNRMQFTPDVLPSDVTGFSLYNKHSGKFEYQPGVAMCNLFLADEINRTSSKTQSALLEIMEEGSVTVDGVTHPLPKPFLVIATQNPIGSIGTQMLPESQLDRFMLQLHMGYPDVNSEIEILKSHQGCNPVEQLRPIVDASALTALQEAAEQIYVDDRIYRYVALLAEATRQHPMIRLGASPRGALALIAVSRATALLHGRDYVTGLDVSYLFQEVLSHRILLEPKAKLAQLTKASILDEILKTVPVPSIQSVSL